MTDVGPTEKLSLRASVATLAQLLIPHPESGETLLALEHKATVHVRDGEPSAHLQAQPFGGAVRIPSPTALQDNLGQFHFDSARSKAEKDFRIFIEPSQWPKLKRLVIDELELDRSPIIDPDPRRELEEEFQDALGYSLSPRQYSSERLRVIVENEPVPTLSWRAPGRMTARMYCIYMVKLRDEELKHRILTTNQRQTPEYLLGLARSRAEAENNYGRANGVFLRPLAEIQDFFQELDASARSEAIPFQNTSLSPSVAAILQDISSPRYGLLSS